MRASATMLAILLITTAMAAQEAAPPETEASAPPATSESSTRPDYSRHSLLRLVRTQEEERKGDRSVRFHVGAVEFNAIGTRWRFNYLPIMAPLSGTRVGITNEWPDPFSLSGTPIATPKRAWRTQRQINAELRRITESEKKRAKVKVNVNVKAE
jgi:hypothetical protein